MGIGDVFGAGADMMRALGVVGMLLVCSSGLAADLLDERAEHATAEWRKSGLPMPSAKMFRKSYQWSLEDERQRGLPPTRLGERELEAETFNCLAAQASAAAVFARQHDLLGKADGMPRITHYMIVACLNLVTKLGRY
jgi:hypothetical protein